jgi:hypothetical protein
VVGTTTVLVAMILILARPSTGFADPVFRIDEPAFPPSTGTHDTVAPVIHLEVPSDSILIRGKSADLHWTASDDRLVSAVDLYVSTQGASGPFTPIVIGAPNTGSYHWLVQGARSEQVTFRAVARDQAGNTGQDLSDDAVAIRDEAPIRIVSLRADSASGTGPDATSNVTTPWKDLAGAHDGYPWGFRGTLASGWKGNGTAGSPYRLEFGNEDLGYLDRILIPAGGVPELQGIVPVTAEVWFRTSFDGPSPDRYEYILEWVEPPVGIGDPEHEGRGMSIIVLDGKLQVYTNPWVEAIPVTPDTWYHVAVTKDVDEMRIYVNGQRVYTGNKPHMGAQKSEIALGASTFRTFEGYTGSNAYGEPFRGAISQLDIWRGTLDDQAVLASFRADSARYLPNPSLPPPHMLVSMRADSANGAGPNGPTGASWFDLAEDRNDASLAGFDGNATSGWNGDGSVASPYRLEFDGVNDRVTIPAASIPQLGAVAAVTADAWIRTGPNVNGPDYQNIVEWIEGLGSSCGMSIAIANGKLQTYLANPYWTEIANVAPDTWYHVAIAKEPGQVRVYLDGVRVFTGITPNIGDQTSEIVWGASTWRGPGQYGEFFRGAMKGLAIWQGALDDHAVQNRYETFGNSLEAAHETSIAPGATALAGAAASGGGAAASFALDRPRRNPAPTLVVSFSLPDASPARIEVFDVAGRRVRSAEVGSLGAGRHLVDLSQGSIPPGHYVVRLAQSGRALTSKVVIAR